MDEWWHPRAHRHGPSRWQKEDGIMTSIAEEDETSEILDMESCWGYTPKTNMTMESHHF